MPRGYDPSVNKERLRTFSGGAAPNRMSTDQDVAAEVAFQRASDPPEPVELTPEQESFFSFDSKDPHWEGMNQAQIHAEISEQLQIPYPGAPAARFPDWVAAEGPQTMADALERAAKPKAASKPKARKQTAKAATAAPEAESDYDTVTMGGVTFWLVPEAEYAMPDSIELAGATYYLVPQ